MKFMNYIYNIVFGGLSSDRFTIGLHDVKGLFWPK